MKKYLFLFSLIFTILAISSCGNDEEMDKLRAQNDSLMNVANESNTQVDKYMAAFNDIQQNLNTIKQKEHIIDLNSVDSSEMTPDMKEQINDDILSIYELMQENESALTTLKNKIKSSGIKNKELETTLSLYEEQMDQKNDEISTLKKKLEDMDFNMQELNNQISDMKSDIDTMKQIQNQQDNVIDEQDAKLHTAFYVIGTKEELKNNGIISKNGVLSKLELDADFDKTYFTKVDSRELSEIPINSKKIEILTQHPSNSFTLVEEDKIISKLSITNQDNFWSLSKFCVIMLK